MAVCRDYRFENTYFEFEILNNKTQKIKRNFRFKRFKMDFKQKKTD